MAERERKMKESAVVELIYSTVSYVAELDRWTYHN